MSSPLALDLAIVIAVATGCWHYRTNPRVMAAGFWLGAFFIAMAVPTLAGAIAASIALPLGVAVLVGLDVYGGYVAAHEVWTGKHNHPVRTQLFAMLGGLAMAGTYVGWPQVSYQLKHLLPETAQALGRSASTARAHSTTMGPQQVKQVLIEALIGVGVVTFLLWRHHKGRVKATAGPAVAAVEQGKINLREARGRKAKAQAKAELERAQAQVKQAGRRVMQVKPVQELRARKFFGAVRKATGKRGAPEFGGTPARSGGGFGRRNEVYGSMDPDDYGPPSGTPALPRGRRG